MGKHIKKFNESEFNKDELMKRFHELKKKGGPITLQDVAGEDLINQAAEHHKKISQKSDLIKLERELNKHEYETLSEYHFKSRALSLSNKDVVSDIGTFINSDNEECTGYKVNNDKLIFFDLQSDCVCIDEDGTIHEIGLYELE